MGKVPGEREREKNKSVKIYTRTSGLLCDRCRSVTAKKKDNDDHVDECGPPDVGVKYKYTQ